MQGPLVVDTYKRVTDLGPTHAGTRRATGALGPELCFLSTGTLADSKEAKDLSCSALFFDDTKHEVPGKTPCPLVGGNGGITRGSVHLEAICLVVKAHTSFVFSHCLHLRTRV